VRSLISFMALGVTNARRNLSRSLLTICGMAVAAAVLSANLSLGAGYPAGAYDVHRTFLGGDVLVLPFRYEITSSDRPDNLRFDIVPADAPGDLAAFFPEVYQKGFLRVGGGSGYRVDLDVVLRAVHAAAGAGAGAGTTAGATVYPHYFLPVVEAYDPKPVYQGGPVPPPEALWHPVALRSRNIELDLAHGFDRFIRAGRCFEPGDSGRLVCLVDMERAKLEHRTKAPTPAYASTGSSRAGLTLQGVEPLTPTWNPQLGDLLLQPHFPGQSVTVLIPRPFLGPDGTALLFDYSQLTPVKLEVVGVYSLPTINVVWREEVGGAASEQLYWATPDILVPEETLRAIFEAIGGTPGSLRPAEVAVGASGMAGLEDFTAALRALLPDNQVFSVPSLVDMAHERGLPEPVMRAPVSSERTSYGTYDPGRRVQPGLPADPGFTVMALIYLVAAALAATNIAVLLTARRTEIAVIRSLGARRYEVLTMVLAEVVTLAALGALIGFALTRLPALHLMLTNRVPPGRILVLAGSELARILALTLGFTLVLGALAARSATTVSPMEVWRKE